jgi:hypothetical protein
MIMASSRKFTLTRHLPGGIDAPVPGITAAKVRMWVSMCLVDNGAAPRSEADPFAWSVTSAPVGTRVEHPSSFAFTVHPAEKG